ncbi:hypothetical protein BXY57_1646 [Thermoflavifilum aggregans]|uniref:Uncharacterized protein n=1 Tax=Thermoflavifilum aggregans TaxID=454188 RepID=A0A2M9CVZ1_9BACT|nr:hypothetical protein [Thermoflavifilum aggregans]PJJ76047.1 hypothetical protein BXY57_1646 [Thermoflavifilum aggregans]
MNSWEFTKILFSLCLGLIYWSAGLSKLAPYHIGNFIGPVDLDKVFNSPVIHIGMILIAAYQVISGTLLLSQKYNFLGVMLSFPMSLGIFLFTAFTGFELTPLINLFLLAMLTYVLLQEKESVSYVIRMRFKDALKNSSHYNIPVNTRMEVIAITISFLIVPLSFFIQGILLPLLASLSLLLFTIQMFQTRKLFLLIDKTLLILVIIDGIMIVNGVYLISLFRPFFIIAFSLIPICFLLYLIRIGYYAYLRSSRRMFS